MNSESKFPSKQGFVQRLNEAVDSLLEFECRHGPYDDERGEWHLGYPLGYDLDEELDLLAYHLIECLTWLEIEPPDWADIPVPVGYRKHHVLGLLFTKDNRLITPSDWRVRIKMLKISAARSLVVIEQKDEHMEKPSWDSSTKILSFRGVDANYRRKPAENQYKMLDAFQAQGWASVIDAPKLGDPPSHDSKKIDETIRALTKKHRLLSFTREGEGLRIGWHPKEPD